MRLSAQDSLELEEADLYDTTVPPQAHDSHQEHEAQSEQSQSEDEDVFGDAMRTPMMEIGPQSGSARSTTLNVVLEEEVDVLGPPPQSLHGQPEMGWGPMASSVRQRSSRQSFMPHSLPVHSANVKMGSSVPINIPFMLRPTAPGKPTEAQNAPLPAPTFVPPHQLSQRDEYTLAMMGESPGGVLKRDRLRMRNSILKSTGFLEGASLLPGYLAGVGAVGGGEAIPIPNMRTTPGGLSQALQLVGSPAHR